MQTPAIPLIVATNAPEIMVAKVLAPLPIPLSATANAHEAPAVKVGAACHANPEDATHLEGFVIEMIGITIERRSLRTMSSLTLAACK